MSKFRQLSKRSAVCSCLVLLACLAAPAQALKSDFDQPVNIESDEQFADLQANKAVFIGNVYGTQGTIEIHCDKAELYRNEKNELKEVHAYGNPVTFRQRLDNGKTIRSQSAVLEYFPPKDLVVLTGRATIWQEESHVNGERIEYNLVTERMRASNPNRQGGRVRSTFIPSEFKNNKKESAAAGPASGPSGSNSAAAAETGQPQSSSAAQQPSDSGKQQ